MKKIVFLLALGVSSCVFSQNNTKVMLSDYLDKHSSYSELESVLSYLKMNDFQMNYIPSIFPLKDVKNFRISSVFASRYHPIEKINKFHTGIDIAAEIGTLVLASADGYINKIRFSNYGYGRYIQIDHKFGYQSKYAHLSIVLVKKNEFVRKGDVIGMVGSTGGSTGNHLHYEVIKNKKHCDPSDYFFLESKFKSL